MLKKKLCFNILDIFDRLKILKIDDISMLLMTTMVGTSIIYMKNRECLRYIFFNCLLHTIGWYPLICASFHIFLTPKIWNSCILFRQCSTQVHKYRSIQVNKYTSTQEHKNTSTQVHKYTNTYVHKCTSTQELSFAMYLYIWIDGKLPKFPKWSQLVRQQLG